MSNDASREPLANALGADADHVVMERGFSLAFVGANGHVRLVQFRLSKKGFSTDHAADATEFAAMLDDFSAAVQRQLEARWNSAMAMRAAFDGEGELIERLYEVGILVRCDEVDPASPAGRLVKEDEQVDARELLVRASARLVENWGVFEREAPDAREAHLRQWIAGA
jgi:hypothetical protein